MPTAVICSDPFVPLARSESEILGVKALPLVVIRHPLGGIGRAEVRERAAQALPIIVKVLTGSDA